MFVRFWGREAEGMEGGEKKEEGVGRVRVRARGSAWDVGLIGGKRGLNGLGGLGGCLELYGVWSMTTEEKKRKA